MQKNVLLIIPHLTDGGAERVVSELSRTLSLQYNVFLLLFEDNVSYPYWGEKIIFKDSASSFFKKILALKKLKKAYNIHFSISFLVIPNLINVLSRKSDKVILTVHTNLTQYNKRKGFLERLKNLLQVKLLYNKADYVVAVSKGIEKDLRENFRITSSKLKTIYNFYDFNSLYELANQEIRPEHQRIFSKPVIINIGRLTYSKGQWNLLKAFKDLKKRIDANLVILGEGKLRHQYSEFIIQNNLSDSVFLLGFQKNPFPLIKASTVFISSSKFEGLSNVILEALILKIPIVATDCISGPREILVTDTEPSKQITESEYHPTCILLPYLHPEKINLYDELSICEQYMSNALLAFLNDAKLRTSCAEKAVLRASYFESKAQSREWFDLLK